MHDHMANRVIDRARCTKSSTRAIRIVGRVVFTHTHRGAKKESANEIRNSKTKTKLKKHNQVTYRRCPSAFAKAQWAAVKITRLAITEPAQGYAKAPVLISENQQIFKYFFRNSHFATLTLETHTRHEGMRAEATIKVSLHQ